MNPLHLLRDWLVPLVASLGLKHQLEVSDTGDTHRIYLIAGSPKHGRCEVLVASRSQDAWWPVTIGGTECKDAGELNELLGAMEAGVRERICQELNLESKEKVA